MELKHTPGPWNQGRQENGEMVWFQRYDLPLWEGTQDEEHQANMRLLDAAPDLLAVAQQFAAWNKRYPSTRIYSESAIRNIAAELDQIAAAAGAAIAKATGGQP